MRIRYTLDRWDLFLAGARAILHQRVILIIVVPLTAYIWWSTFTYDQNRSLPMIVRVITSTMTAAISLSIGVAAGVTIAAAQAFLRKDQGVLGEHTLEITPDGLVESTEVNRSLANWRTVFRVLETRRYAYVYVSATNAHIIPKHRQPLEGSVDEFLTVLRARIAQCQPAAESNAGSQRR